MRTPDQSQEMPEHTKSSAVYVLRLDRRDGTSAFPAWISVDHPGSQDQLRDAKQYFEHRFRDEGTISVHMAGNLYEAGVADPAAVQPWEECRRSIVSPQFPDKFQALEKQLSYKGVSSTVLGALAEDRDYKTHRQQFLAYVDLYIQDEKQKHEITKALEMAERAHKGQTYYKAKYPSTEAMADVPYVNHSVQVAMLGLKTGAFLPEEIQALLLHDVLEDTAVTLEEIAKEFSAKTVAMTVDMTKGEDESREDFLRRIESLPTASQMGKCLDRLHNLLRSFGIHDAAYLQRTIEESRATYDSMFHKYPALAGLYPLFNHYLQEMEKLP